MKKTRYIIALVAAIFAIGSILFVGCSKDNEAVQLEEVNPTGDIKSAFGNKNLVFGKYSNNGYTYSVNLAELAQKLTGELYAATGSHILVESISVYDDNPQDIENQGFIRISLINVDLNDAATLYFRADKFMENGNVCYTNGNDDNPIKCLLYKCKTTCALIKKPNNQGGSDYWCQCAENKGYCKMGDSSDWDWTLICRTIIDGIINGIVGLSSEYPK